ncbi:PucR family transcriptional regulator [Leucobacter chromiireducens]|uniref:PucR family transcriptional regulator n=1 Tax=Leucobacter chromiireducens TaxID=283877 RepID=UPI000F63A240|nr:PucR family transcriptional regulator [Leucobacter chromiireducens]
MAPTLADLLAEPSLSLTCAAGHQQLHRPVSQVHVAEIRDPSPWLARDLLLLTTGLVERSDAELDQYFAALAARGVAAVGFGVGLTVPDIPAAWLAAADAHAIPLLRIPLSTPYIAVSEYVARRHADRQLDQVRQMLDVQQRLAYSDATPAQQEQGLERLGAELEAAVLWAAPDGIRQLAAPGARLDQAEVRTVATELSRHVASGRSTASSSIGQLYVHVASTAGSPIAVVRRRRYTPLEQGLIGSIATFIDLSRDTVARAGLAASLREQLIAEAVSGRMQADGRLFELLFPGAAECTVAFFGPAAHASQRARREPAAGLLLKSALAASLTAGVPAATPLLASADDGFLVVLPATHADAAAAAIDRFIRAERGSLAEWRAGVSRTAAPARTLELCDEARRAHRASAGSPDLRVLTVADLGTEDELADWLLGSDAPPVFSEWRARLDGLSGAARARVCGALHAFLAANGALERAAEALGVHRQTLNARLREAELTLGVSLDAPTERALLWLAFETGALPGAT